MYPNECIPITNKQCKKLTHFSEDLSPQLTLHVASGHASVGPANEVLVYPGSIFHVDCLFDRRKGNPEWTNGKPGKKYPTGKAIKWTLLWSKWQKWP